MENVIHNKSLGTYSDNILNVEYELLLIDSAKDLANLLKKSLSKRQIDYKKYNTSSDFEGVSTNPPAEIYEYQNFFILESASGNINLLDGFRRLLWYNAPDAPILVRKYNKEDLTDKQILSLLVNLNHFKFYSSSSYYERGFALLLKTVFDVDITTFTNSFNAYLTSDKTKSDYSSHCFEDGAKGNEMVKERIINEFFISDMQFLSSLSKTRYMCDKYFGALLYKQRLTSNEQFDVQKFIELADANKVLQDLTDKYQYVGTSGYSKSQEVVNKILEMYNNIFTLMRGGKVEQSLAEKQKECKDLVTKLKKDKSLIKLTGAKKYWELDRLLSSYIDANKPLKFKCVVHPREYSDYASNNKFRLSHGIIENIEYFGLRKKSLGAQELEFGIKDTKGDKIAHVTHNYGGYWNTGKRYTKISSYSGIPSISYDIDLFVCIPQSEIKTDK